MKHPTFSTKKILAILLTGLLAVLPACAVGLSTVTAGAMPEIAMITVSVMQGGATGAPTAATPAFGPATAVAPNPTQSGATGMNVQIVVQPRNFNIISPTAATGTPGATAAATPTVMVSPTATAVATGTPGATATAVTPTATATMPVTPTATVATATPGATATGAAGAASGHIHYYIDTTVPTTPGVPALTQPGTVVQTTATTFTWTNVMPGTHIFSAQLVNSNHTPIVPLVIATAVITIPTTAGATATPGATTAVTPTATAAATPTVMVSPTATAKATGTPGATSTMVPTMSPTPSATMVASPSATAATGTPGATTAAGGAWVSQVSAQLSAAGAAGASASPAATAAAGGRTVTFAVQTRNVTTNRYAYFMDVMVPTDPNAPATTAAGTFQSSSATSATWSNVMPGAHAFSVEAIDADGTPMAPLVEATIIMTVPGAVASPAATGIPGATSPVASPTMTVTPTATATRTP